MTAPAHTTPVTLHVNAEPRELVVDNRATVLDVLREELDLTGTKKGCDHGQCGACTVLVGRTRMNSCLLLAVAHDGARITTVEGLAGGPAGSGPLHPLQEAFLDRDAYQCGYCTPGQLCSAIGALQEMGAGLPSAVTPADHPSGLPVPADDAEIRERMSGNLCRCGAYGNIVRAVGDVAHTGTAPGGRTGEGGAW